MKGHIHEPLKIFTWHIHGSYLYYLSHTPCQFIVPKKDSDEPGYSGRSGPFPWGENVIEVPASEVKEMEFDCVLFQHRKNHIEDQYEVLSEAQRALPAIYLEHDPPREVPTDTKHLIDDPDALIVHVTHFNQLMWDNNQTPSRVIEHAVTVPEDVRYTGEKERGIVVINNIHIRGRRLGLDVFEQVRRKVPLDIVGMGSEQVGGLGEIPPQELPEFISRYRFFFNPIRYTSLGLAVCEAMMTGLPMVGLATTEMPVTVTNGESGFIHTDIDYLVEKMRRLIEDPVLATTEMPVTVTNGESGFIHTDIDYLVEKMRRLIEDPVLAKKLGDGARATAQRKFDINRFSAEWHDTFSSMAGCRELPESRTKSA